MRFGIDRVGVPLPFIKVIETVAVWVLFQQVRVGNGQAELFNPFVWHRWMHFSRLQCRRLTIGSDNMLFRNKKTGTPAESPLWRLMQLLQGSFHIAGFAGRRGGPLRRARLELSELGLETGCAPENTKSAYQQDRDADDEQHPLVVFLHPIHLAHHPASAHALIFLKLEIQLMSSRVRAGEREFITI